MAIVLNPLMKGIVGELQKGLVFRRMGDKTIVYSYSSAAPKKASPLQLLRRERFRKAMLYAKDKMHDTSTREAYTAVAKRKQKPNGYTVAVADFFHAPVIEETDISCYKKQGKIRARVTDDFKVDHVAVELLDADGILLESGAALPHDNGLDWIYTADHAAAAIVIIKAYDMPGNETVAEVKMSESEFSGL